MIPESELQRIQKDSDKYAADLTELREYKKQREEKDKEDASYHWKSTK